MPKPQTVKSPQYEKCYFHSMCVMDQFCIRHSELLCHQCVCDTHKSCEIKSITDASTECNCTNITQFKDTLLGIRKTIESKLLLFEKNVSDLEHQRNLSVNKIKSTYDSVIFRVEKLFKEANEEIDRVYNKNKTYLVFQIGSLNKVLKNVDKSLTNLQKLKDVHVKTFLHVQNVAKLTREDTFKVNEISKNIRNVGITVSINQEFQEFVNATSYIGTVKELSTQYNNVCNANTPLPSITFPAIMPTDDQDTQRTSLTNSNIIKLDRFNVKLPEDNEECGIVGLDVTPDGRILVADFLNLKIKCFDNDRRYQSCLMINCQPSDLAVANNYEAIVSLWCQSEMYILDMEDYDMVIRKRIKLDHPVSAVSSYKDKIIVNSRDGTGCIKLIDRCGKVFWSRNIDSDENQLFKYPRCNTCFTFKKKLAVIVTDYNKRTMTKLSGRTGDVKCVCRIDGKEPFGVTNDKNGTIYVCYRDSNEISAWSQDMQSQKIFLSESDDLGKWPNCIKYVKKANIMYVCYSALKDCRNFIDCYQIS